MLAQTTNYRFASGDALWDVLPGQPNTVAIHCAFDVIDERIRTDIERLFPSDAFDVQRTRPPERTSLKRRGGKSTRVDPIALNAVLATLLNKNEVII